MRPAGCRGRVAVEGKLITRGFRSSLELSTFSLVRNSYFGPSYTFRRSLVPPVHTPPSSKAMTEQFPTSNRSVVWVGARKLDIQQRPVTAPGPGEVLVEIVSTGICGSDCHNWESDSVSRQLVLGHESAGVIIRLGEGVKDRSVGQRVAVEPGFACNEYVLRCSQCPSRPSSPNWSC